jgi:nitronate monooxygenase
VSTTSFCRSLGIDVPIFNAPLGGGAAGPALAAAVSEAGGCGLVGLIAIPPPAIAGMIAEIRALTAKPFGAGVVLVEPDAPAQIETCLEAKLPLLVLFWGDPTPWVRPARAAGTRVAAQVGSVDEARAAAAAGVDFVIAQGVEAGGHVRGTTPLAELLPAVVESVRPLPVVAAGGIADGRDAARAIRAGAEGVLLGTRFLASDEANVDPEYKRRIVAARAADTLLTTLFDLGWPDAPHRVLRNRIVREWEEAGRPASGRRPGEGEVAGRVAIGGHEIDVPRYSVIPPMPGFTGDAEDFCLYAGESCERVTAIEPAATIVASIVREAREHGAAV